jgi:aspartate aminotransferase-like enzyme
MTDISLANRTLFMLPGPVKMHPRVLSVMATPAINHRGPEFKAVVKELKGLTRYLMQTKDEVAILSGSGTAALDAAICNIAKKDDKILNFVSGKFSERMNNISNVYGTAKAVEFPWGAVLDKDKVSEALEEDDWKIVTICHNETSTGVTNPAKDIAQMVKKKTNALFVVDAITAVGGLEVKPDEWGYDVTIVGSQKCLAAPAGLALMHVSKRAEEMLHEDNSYYLNVKKHIKSLDDGQTPYTPAVPLFLSLWEALKLLKDEGLENRLTRTSRLAQAARSAVSALGLQLFPEERYASNTVTAIRYPEGIKDDEFRKILKNEYDLIVAGGQAQVKGKIWRIGTMGICSFDDLYRTFERVEPVLQKLGYEFEKGASLNALEEHKSVGQRWTISAFLEKSGQKMDYLC